MPYPAKILVVENDEILADNLRLFLGQRSPDVRVAHDAETAMEILGTFAPALLVIDYALPGINGLSAYGDFVRRARARPACIMIAGNPTALLAERAHRLGIHHLLCKPVSFSELELAVEMSFVDAPAPLYSPNRRLADRRRTPERPCVFERRTQPSRRQAQGIGTSFSSQPR